MQNLYHDKKDKLLKKLSLSFFFFPPCSRLKVMVEYFKMALDCFFAVWFVVGNVWIFGGHSSPSDAPNLYRYWELQH